jgi:hypothetical protein
MQGEGGGRHAFSSLTAISGLAMAGIAATIASMIVLTKRSGYTEHMSLCYTEWSFLQASLSQRGMLDTESRLESRCNY